MANKRQLKRAINMMCGELIVECVAISHGHKNVNNDDVNNVLKSVLLLQDSMISRISHPEPGMPAKEFFKKLRYDMAKETDQIVDQLYALA